MRRLKFNLMSVRRMVMRGFFIITVSSGILTAAILAVVYFTELSMTFGREFFYVMLISVMTSVIVGIILSIPISRLILNPVRSLSTALECVADGDFTVRVNEKKGPEEFRQMYEAFNRMVYALGENEIFRRDFINNFSHEFKTPIASIRGFALRLEKEPELDEETKKKYIYMIANESERLANMATNVLLLTKFENQLYVNNEKEVELDEQIRQCILVLEKEWTSKNIELDIDLENVTYECDDEMLRQLWINLISNAIKFTGNGGKVCVYMKRQSDYITVTIKDNGIGMSEEQLEHAFDRFYQADISHATKGNGLGLTLVKRIIELMQAGMTVKSNLGEGTEFEIKLPCDVSIYSPI